MATIITPWSIWLIVISDEIIRKKHREDHVRWRSQSTPHLLSATSSSRLLQLSQSTNWESCPSTSLTSTWLKILKKWRKLTPLSRPWSSAHIMVYLYSGRVQRHDSDFAGEQTNRHRLRNLKQQTNPSHYSLPLWQLWNSSFATSRRSWAEQTQPIKSISTGSDAVSTGLGADFFRK